MNSYGNIYLSFLLHFLLFLLVPLPLLLFVLLLIPFFTQFSLSPPRYCFLAFNFDERVTASKENCRLLLLRLKMDGWALGKTKVFLKYYHVEYLTKMYEKQVRSERKAKEVSYGGEERRLKKKNK